MNIVESVRATGLAHRVRADGEVIVDLKLPNYQAYLTKRDGQVWCELAECYAGSLLVSGLLPTVQKAIEFANYHAAGFEARL
jgi:hypothetical protein